MTQKTSSNRCEKVVKTIASKSCNRKHTTCYNGNHDAKKVSGYALHRYFGVTTEDVNRHDYYQVCHTLNRNLVKNGYCSSKLNEVISNSPRRSGRTSDVTASSSFAVTEPSSSREILTSPHHPPPHSSSPSSAPLLTRRMSPRILLKKRRSKFDVILDEVKKRKVEYRIPTQDLKGKSHKKRISSLASQIIASCINVSSSDILDDENGMDHIRHNLPLASQCFKVLQAVQYEIELITRVPTKTVLDLQEQEAIAFYAHQLEPNKI